MWIYDFLWKRKNLEKEKASQGGPSLCRGALSLGCDKTVGFEVGGNFVPVWMGRMRNGLYFICLNITAGRTMITL